MRLSWRTIPMRWRQSWSALCGSVRRTVTSPEVRSRYPSRNSTVVVFPAPLGPRKAKICRGATSRSMPRTASSGPYDLRSPRTLITGSTRRIVWTDPLRPAPVRRDGSVDLDVAVDDSQRDVVVVRKMLRDPIGDRQGSVLAAGAANRDRQVRLALGDVGG